MTVQYRDIGGRVFALDHAALAAGDCFQAECAPHLNRENECRTVYVTVKVIGESTLVIFDVINAEPGDPDLVGVRVLPDVVLGRDLILSQDVGMHYRVEEVQRAVRTFKSIPFPPAA